MKAMREAKYPMYTGRDSFTSIREALDRALRLFPNNAGCKYLKDNNLVSVTYTEIFSDIKKMGSYIYNRCGYAKDKAAFISNSIYPWFITYLSALYYGCTIVPLDQLLNVEDLVRQIEYADVTTLFFNSKNIDKVKQIKQILKKEIEYICLDSETDFSDSYSGILERQKVIDAPESINGDDLAEIVFTSGTTGTSKGVMISHYNIASVLMFCTNIFDLSEHDDMITFLPNNHLYFLSTGLIIPLYFGSAVCLNDSVFNFMRDMRIFKPSSIMMVPTLLHLLRREIISKIKEEGLECLRSNGEGAEAIRKQIIDSIGGNVNIIGCGGASLDEETIAFYNLLGIDLINGYGLSECSPLVSCSIQRRIDKSKYKSVGIIGPCCEAKVVDGELWVSGANVMLGYYKNPELTNETIVDGWLKTGDLGYIDEDGYFYLTGRKKNLIILSNGENVCPEELENLIYYIEGINSVLVYDENDAITAEIFLDQKAIEEKHISDPEEYVKGEINNINKKLPVYKHIKNIKFRDKQFDMTSTMKIKR